MAMVVNSVIDRLMLKLKGFLFSLAERKHSGEVTVRIIFNDGGIRSVRVNKDEEFLRD